MCRRWFVRHYGSDENGCFQMNAVSILLGLIACVVATATASENKFGLPAQPGEVKDETFDFGAAKKYDFTGYQNFEDPYSQSGETKTKQHHLYKYRYSRNGTGN